MRRQIFAVMTFLIAITLHAADSPLAGTWRLTGADEVRPDGSIAEPYGARPKGLLIIHIGVCSVDALSGSARPGRSTAPHLESFQIDS